MVVLQKYRSEKGVQKGEVVVLNFAGYELESKVLGKDADRILLQCIERFGKVAVETITNELAKEERH